MSLLGKLCSLFSYGSPDVTCPEVSWKTERFVTVAQCEGLS